MSYLQNSLSNMGQNFTQNLGQNLGQGLGSGIRQGWDNFTQNARQGIQDVGNQVRDVANEAVDVKANQLYTEYSQRARKDIMNALSPYLWWAIIGLILLALTFILALMIFVDVHQLKKLAIDKGLWWGSKGHGQHYAEAKALHAQGARGDLYAVKGPQGNVTAVAVPTGYGASNLPSYAMRRTVACQ